MSVSLRDQFLLNPEIIYLNHGSFGACPKPVMQVYQDWQYKLEENPIDYFVRQIKGPFGKEVAGPLETARQALSEYVGADGNGMIFTPNVTVALNMIAHSLELSPGDTVLTTDHEYGTIDRTWERKCARSGARLKRVPLPLPTGDREQWANDFWQSVDASTKVILMSHITSATALVLPVEEICRRARAAHITTIIDGAHAVGQLPLDLQALDADFYTSNCHKWLLTPKGTAFLAVHERQRETFDPMIVSWAEINRPAFHLRHEMWGTRDLAPFLSIPAALAFRKQFQWERHMQTAREIVRDQRQRFAAAFETELICDETWLGQMASVVLPKGIHAVDLWEHLWREHHIEAMITHWKELPLLRLGYNAYNTPSEMDVLLKAITTFHKG